MAYQFPESADAWDGNWLRCTAVYEQLAGRATLGSVEPELTAEVRAVGRKGDIEVRVEITPDHMNQAHRFIFTMDQSYLPAVLRACERLLGQHPVRDAAARGA